MITGSSAGIGKETVKFFLNRGWNVAATMRRPEKETELKISENLKIYQLDVTDRKSIEKAISQTLQDFGVIDVLVNNAGYGAVGIFEAATEEVIRKQFETNVFGVMSMIKLILPQFRAQKKGTIINVTSMGGLITFPVYSLYHSTKWAVEGFSESLAYELKPLGIRVKTILPGAIKTEFYERSMVVFKDEALVEYEPYFSIVHKNMEENGKRAPGPLVVAKEIFKAATDRSFKLRYPVGEKSPMLLRLRKLLPLSWFLSSLKLVLEKGFKK